MDKERNAHQIVRKDGKGCFVEMSPSRQNRQEKG